VSDLICLQGASGRACPTGNTGPSDVCNTHKAGMGLHLSNGALFVAWLPNVIFAILVVALVAYMLGKSRMLVWYV
jgi:hypothetical protein